MSPEQLARPDELAAAEIILPPSSQPCALTRVLQDRGQIRVQADPVLAFESLDQSEIVLMPFADNERIGIKTRRVIDVERHEHVVHALQDQLAEQVRKIAALEQENTLLRTTATNQHVEHLRGELERAGDMLRQTRLERKWARVNEHRKRMKLEATRERLAHVKRDLEGAHIGNARSARKIARLRAENERQSKRDKWVIEQQRRTIAESNRNLVIQFDSGKQQEIPIFANTDAHREAINVFVVDERTGEAWLVKSRYGIPTTSDIKSARSKIEVLEGELAIERDKNNSLANDIRRWRSIADADQVIAELREELSIERETVDLLQDINGSLVADVEHWKSIAESTRVRMQLQNLGMNLGLAFERFAHAMTRVVGQMQIDALRFQIKRNESFEMERKRLELQSLESQKQELYRKLGQCAIERVQLEAQRDNASARVNAQGLELVAAREKIETLTETNDALAKHAADLRKQSEWNETRWREAATRSDEWRDKFQASREELAAPVSVVVSITTWDWKVGDRVEVMSASSWSDGIESGEIGKIVRIDQRSDEMPVLVRLEKNDRLCWPPAGCFKLVERAS